MYAQAENLNSHATENLPFLCRCSAYHNLSERRPKNQRRCSLLFGFALINIYFFLLLLMVTSILIIRRDLNVIWATCVTLNFVEASHEETASQHNIAGKICYFEFPLRGAMSLVFLLLTTFCSVAEFSSRIFIVFFSTALLETLNRQNFFFCRPFFFLNISRISTSQAIRCEHIQEKTKKKLFLTPPLKTKQVKSFQWLTNRPLRSLFIATSRSDRRRNAI